MDDQVSIYTPSRSFDLSQNSVSHPGLSRSFVQEATLFNDSQIKTLEMEEALFSWPQAAALKLLKQHPEATLRITIHLENLAFFLLNQTPELTQEDTEQFIPLSFASSFECGLKFVPSPVKIFDLGGTDLSRLGGAILIDKVELGLMKGASLKRRRIAVDKVRFSFHAKRFLNDQCENIKLCAGIFDLLGFVANLEIQSKHHILYHQKIQIRIKDKTLTLPKQDDVLINSHVPPNNPYSIYLDIRSPFQVPKISQSTHLSIEGDFSGYFLHPGDFTNWEVSSNRIRFFYEPTPEQEKVVALNFLFQAGDPKNTSSFIRVLCDNFLEYDVSGVGLYGRIIEAMALGHLDILTFSLEMGGPERVSVLQFLSTDNAFNIPLPKAFLFLRDHKVNPIQRLFLLSFYLRFHTGQAISKVILLHKQKQTIGNLDERLLKPMGIALEM